MDRRLAANRWGKSVERSAPGTGTGPRQTLIRLVEIAAADQQAVRHEAQGSGVDLA